MKCSGTFRSLRGIDGASIPLDHDLDSGFVPSMRNPRHRYPSSRGIQSIARCCCCGVVAVERGSIILQCFAATVHRSCFFFESIIAGFCHFWAHVALHFFPFSESIPEAFAYFLCMVREVMSRGTRLYASHCTTTTGTREGKRKVENTTLKHRNLCDA